MGLCAALGQGRQLKFDKGVELQNWRVRSQDVVKLIKNRAAGTPSHKTIFFQFQCENTGPTSRSTNQSNSLTTGSRFHPAASLSASQGPRPIERPLDRPWLPWVVMPSHSVYILPTILKKVSPVAVARCTETPFKMKKNFFKSSLKKYRGKSLTYWTNRWFPHGFAKVLTFSYYMHTGQ